MLLSADSGQSPRESKLIRAQLQRGAPFDSLRYCRELAHFRPAAGRPGRPALLSEQVMTAGEVCAIEADRLILPAGTVIRIPLEVHVPRIPPAFPRPLLGRRCALPDANRAWCA